MRSILYNIPIPFTDRHVPIHAYGVMLMIGFLVALFLANRRARRAGLDPAAIVDLGLVALCAGVFGARFFYVVENWRMYFGRPSGLLDALKLWDGGLVFYGGFLGGAAAMMLFLRAKRLPLGRMLDVIAPSGMIGLAFGRMGCYLNGCCYGMPTTLPWGVVYPADSIACTYGGVAPGAHLHPTQIYESLAALCIFVILDVYFDHNKRAGMVAVLLCILYPAWRFFVEFLRADTAVEHGLTVSQVASLIVFAVALVVGTFLISRPPNRETAPRRVRRAAERHRSDP